MELSEEHKIIEYLNERGFANSVIGSVKLPTCSEIGDPYATRNVSVTVASVMAEYIKSRAQPTEQIDQVGVDVDQEIEQILFGEMVEPETWERIKSRVKQLIQKSHPESKGVEEAINEINETIDALDAVFKLGYNAYTAESVKEALKGIKTMLEG